MCYIAVNKLKLPR